MRRNYLLVGMLMLSALVLTTRADSQTDGVSVAGAVDKPGDWTIARLKSDLPKDVQQIEFTRHGQKHVATVAPLLKVLEAAGIKTELKMGPTMAPTQKNYPLRLVVVVSGRDGYTSTFSLAELLPDFGNHPAWLEIDEDGKPLPPNYGPLSLLVPDDVKPGRWVHGVGAITVLDASIAATQPTAQGQ
jgi:hypothetical protein